MVICPQLGPQPQAQRSAPVPLPGPRQPATPQSVQEAIDEVNQVIESLKQSVDEMEGVMELL